jgi:4-hydroxy-2-oxoglutarate aldolase
MAELVAALATPFTEHGTVDHAGLQENLAQLARSPLTGVLLLGTTGEHPLLDFTEKVELIETAAAHRGRLDLYVQVFHQDERHTRALSEIAHRSGAKGVLALTPTYYTRQYRQEVLRRYYGELLALGPTYLYYIPQNAGLLLSPDDILDLAGLGLAGMKDSSGTLAALGEVLARRPQGFDVLVGAGEGLLGALAQGAEGGILAAAQVAPWLVGDVAAAFAAGDLAGAQAHQSRLARLAAAVGRRYGIPGVKHAMARLGLAAGNPRPPLPPLSPEGAEEIDRLLVELAIRSFA